MYPHALIIAALSASAIAGMSLTAYDHTDSTCSGTAIGNHIGLSGSQCMLYQPEQSDAYIKVIWVSRTLDTYHNITIFSDANCMDKIANFGASETASTAGLDGCYSMSAIAGGRWGSAKAGAKTL